MRNFATTTGALLLACALLSGCRFNVGLGSTPPLAKQAIQKHITDTLTSAGTAPAAVTCQDDLVGEVGKTALCDVDLGPTNSIEVILRVTSVNGSTVNYQQTPAVSRQQLEKSVSALTSQGPPDSSVSCETGLDGTVGAVAFCDVGAEGATVRRMVNVTGVEGLALNYVVVPVLVKADVESSLLDQLAQQLGQRPDSANCADNLQGKTGMSVDCVVTSGARTQTFILTVTTVDGSTVNFSYQAKPQ